MLFLILRIYCEWTFDPWTTMNSAAPFIYTSAMYIYKLYIFFLKSCEIFFTSNTMQFDWMYLQCIYFSTRNILWKLESNLWLGREIERMRLIMKLFYKILIYYIYFKNILYCWHRRHNVCNMLLGSLNIVFYERHGEF